MHLHALSGKGFIPQTAFYALLGVSRSGGDKLKKKDPAFPKPIKFGESRQAAAYYVIDEAEAYLDAKIAERNRYWDSV